MFIDNLRHLLEVSHETQKDLAALLNVKQNTISDWLNKGNSPKLPQLQLISEHFGVSLDWLVNGVNETDAGDMPDDDDMIEIKVYDEPAAAGLGSYLSGDEPFEMVEFAASEVPRRADCGIRITGRSMQPLIHSGDIVFVEYTPVVEHGEIGIFVYDEKAYCKKLYTDRKNGVMKLVSLNEAYDPITVSRGVDFRTLGRVLLRQR